MIRRALLSVTGTLAALVLLLSSVPAMGIDVPPAASVSGKYTDLVQIMPCPKDRGSYGEFRDYGYWGGGSWCGQSGKPGYWVWVAPKWYVWKRLASTPVTPPDSQNTSVPAMASVNGKYHNLIQIMPCSRDRGSYGTFRDYGYWGGGSWCGQTGKAGYWVWVPPNWYVWSSAR